MALRGDRPPIGLAFLITWPLSAALAASVFLSASELRHSFRPVDAPAPALTTSEWNAQLPGRIAALDAALRKGPLRLAAPIEEDRGASPLRYKHRLYEIQLTRADQGKAEATIEAVRAVDPGVVLRTVQNADDTEVHIGLDGLQVSTVRLLWRENPKARPRIAVVVGPFGDDLRLARRVIEMIDAPIVLGVQPQRPFAAQVAELGALFDREVVVQFEAPPPPPPTPTPNPDPLAPTPPAPPRPPAPPNLDKGLTAVPKAVGVAYTGGAVGLPKVERGLLAAADKRALPVVGDRGDKRPGALPLPVVLIDDPRRPEALGEQLAKVGEAARRYGRAVVVAMPTDASVDALQAQLPRWRADELEIVPLSVVASTVAAPPVTPTAQVAGR